jgi:hypothetical protein
MHGEIGALWAIHERGQYAFASLWDSINANRGLGWEANPWVWVIGFRKLERRDDGGEQTTSRRGRLLHSVGSKPRNEPCFMLGDDMPRGVRVFGKRSDALAYKATMFDPSVAAVVKVRITTAQ